MRPRIVCDLARMPGEGSRYLVLVAMILALGMLTIDVTVVRVALPTIQQELGASDVEQQWVVNAYLLTLGVFVVAGGRAGDLLGRRRVFLAGLGIFTACSVLSGTAGSAGALIAARAGQGAGAAIMTPGTFSVVTDAFAGPRLGRAIGALTGTAAAGLSIGPLLGGFLIAVAGWRWIFFINVPLGVLAAIAVARNVPDRRRPDAPRFDMAGLVTLGLGLTALTVGLMQGEGWGWGSPRTLGAIAAGVAGLALFWAIERRVDAPLVDPRMLRRRELAAANGVGFCAQFVSTGFTVLVAIYLQSELGYSPLATGALLLPMTVPLLIASPLSGRLVERFGSRRLSAAGMGLVAVGVAAVAGGATTGRLGPLLPGFVLFGIGFATVLTTLTTAVMAAAGALDRGAVSGIYNTARNVGATLGVAVTSSVLFTFERWQPFADAFAAALAVAAATAAVGAGVALAFLARDAPPPSARPHRLPLHG
jgi:EmrB/QacA subfamily drug resistance transporter